MAAEELGRGAPPLRAVPWWEPLGPGGRRERPPAPGRARRRAGLVAARAALVPAEVERFRALGRETAAATGAALRAAAGGESEFALAGRAARELLDRGIDPVVLLVAGEERLPLHRHPLPTAAPLGARAMLVVCGRRHGLICSVTRMRAWTPLRPAERATTRGCSASRPPRSTRPGRAPAIGDVVRAIADAYPGARLPPGRVAPAPPGRPDRVRAARLPREPGVGCARRRPAGLRLEPVGRRLQGRGHRARHRGGDRGAQPGPGMAGGGGRRARAAGRAGLSRRGAPCAESSLGNRARVGPSASTSASRRNAPELVPGRPVASRESRRRLAARPSARASPAC